MSRTGEHPTQARASWGAEEFRAVVGHFASGVTVITARRDGCRYGTTASAVSSLSLEPPMMLVCLNRTSSTRQAVVSTGRLAINILGEDQAPLARRFATKAPDKFDGVPTVDAESGVPVLTEALARLECVVVEEVTGGTHSVFLVEVIAGTADTTAPLAYYRGQFGRVELGGVAVRPFTLDSFRQALTAQAAIELGVAVLTIGHTDRPALERLRELNEQLRPPAQGDDISLGRWMIAYNAFHAALVGLAGSPDLVRALERVNVHMTLAAMLEADGGPADEQDLSNMALTYREHAEILSAYLNGRLEAALAAIRAHHDRVAAAPGRRLQSLPEHSGD